MKPSAIVIATILVGTAGTTLAAGQAKVMPRVNVQAEEISTCTPPTDAPECADFHRWIRAHFTEQEISMLFGCWTCHPEYWTGGIYRLQKRYRMLLEQYIAAHPAMHTGTDVVSK